MRYWGIGLFLLTATAGLVQYQKLNVQTLEIALGEERLVSWEPLPGMDGAACEWVPASASTTLAAALQESPGQREESVPPRPNEQARADVARRAPIYTIRDPHFAFAGIAVDPIRNEVVLAEENVSSLLVYDRLTNTPPSAVLSEPKRVIGGENSFLEYACSVYIDPGTGDIYGVNNDTTPWMPVFGRDASGNVAPKRKFATPHTTFGIVADEEAQELFLTIQDDHAIVVFRKDAKDEDSPVRIVQGSQTQMADPHGITLDPKTGLIYVSNWGTSNDRPALSEGGGGGNVDRPDFPVGRARAYLGSGKIAPPSITVYHKNAQGDTPPVRVIQGPGTQLDWPTALAIHPDRGEIFVANDTADSVIVFRTDASGDAAPIRVIKGPRTMVKNPTGVAVDLKNNELWVANFGSHSATVFDIGASGDVPPKRIIRSGPIDAPSPNLSNPHTVAFDSKRDEILVAN
jgi:DNA-binding beta-propeller fold protein YncE